MKFTYACILLVLTFFGCTTTNEAPAKAQDLYAEEEWAVPYPDMADRLVWAFVPKNSEVEGLVVSNDGQTRYFLMVEEALEDLVGKKKIPKVAVLSVCMGDRLQEYGFQDGKVSLVSDDGRGGEMGTKAHIYEKWIVEVLIPFAEKKWGKTFSAEKRLVVGSSLGGISAFSTAINYPQVFNGAGCLSPSFWVSSKTDDPLDLEDRRIGIKLLKMKNPKTLPRIWMSAGEVEGNLAKSTQVMYELLMPLAQPGNKNLKCQILVDGEHNNDTWSKLFPEILEWYFGQ